LIFILLAITASVAFYASVRGIHPILAWFLSSPIIPVFVLLDFFLNLSGGGASMFPISLIFGGIYGVLAGGGGAVAAAIFLKIKSNKVKSST